MSKTCAIVLAGGSGLRMGKGMPKQLLPMGRHTIIEWTISLFEMNENVQSVVVVSPPDYMDEIKNLVKRRGRSKVAAVVPGGAARKDSSWNGLAAMKFSDDDIILLHDAARPFTARETIDRCIESARETGAAGAYVKAVDTITEIAGDVVVSIPSRDTLYYTQTPQAFRYDVIRSAHEHALNGAMAGATDDVSLALAAGFKVVKVEGSYENIKITTPSDYEYACYLVEKGIFKYNEGRG